MYKVEKEVEQVLLNNEKNVLKQLEQTYVKALADIKGRLRLLQAREETQSVIYQINYQKSLEKQINAITGVLQQDNITTVQDFLNHMYEDGYIGIQYELMKQGVPVITSINQIEVISSLFKKTGRMTFADRMNVNMKDFKQKVKDTITRGIASGSTYRDIASQLSLVTSEDLYKSYRIARTEGHRITTEAKLNSMKKAKEQGADVVKQWDATLDGKTRKNHRKLDGQWVEVDGYFEIGGRKVKAPAKFGKAGEDINCRCILLTRPRWAVDKRRTKSAKITDEYGKEVEKLIEVNNYDDYKKGYYKVLEEDPDIEKKVKEVNKLIAKGQAKGNVKINTNNSNIKYNLPDDNSKFTNTIKENIEILANEYKTPLKEVSYTSAKKTMRTGEAGSVDGISGTKLIIGQATKETIYHEFAHTLATEQRYKLLNENTKFWEELIKIRKDYYKEVRNIDKRALTDKSFNRLEALNDIKLVPDNRYFEESIDEFLAEGFAYAKLEKTKSPYAKRILELVDKYFKK